MWQAGLAGWMQNAEPIGPMLQADMNTRVRKEQQDNQAIQKHIEYERQKEFAKHGIRWKVEDAKAAGIHPLYALGGAGSAYSPAGTTIADSSGAPQVPQADLRGMSQDISRAISASSSAEERQFQQLQVANARADLDGKVIDNQIRASQLQKMNQAGPAFPSPMDGAAIEGQGNSVRVKPSEVYASQAGKPGVQSGAINTLQYTRETDGSVGVAPSADAKERLEDDFIAESMWHIKNRLNPPAPSAQEIPIPQHLRKQGYKYWLWNPFQQKFIPSKNP